ncbi:hypothetical protein AWW66_01245 [Micromonospora rosaria]|uniref:OmpR/PhoB-type domain-containing protein n=1 Tax=Micromonospora rosaria TaxID=47874 RepID=A0A136Q085_9ACTN|nr:hypothetical protein AWW66_01245 [Micromonospora rosaria]
MLGSLEVIKGDRDCTPSAPKLRELLALLLLQSNRVIPTETLATELWRGEMPRSAQATLQTYIYQLRKILCSERGGENRDILMTRPPGYVINTTCDQLDATRFDHLVRSGRAALDDDDPATASTMLHSGLSLWRGAALADVEPGPRLAAHIAWLEETRLTALELRIQADFRLGRYRELVGELRALTALHPLNEWLHRQLMIALHATGRRTDALAVYRDVRRILREEVGLEPSHQLQHAQQAILADAPLRELASY